jgi:Ca2+-binding EF-hand superfamily protein
MQVRKKFENAGDSLRQTFKIYDKNNDGTLNKKELDEALRKNNIIVDMAELLYLYKFIDLDNSDSISYNELSDVLFGKTKLDTIKLIKEHRAKLGKNTGISAEEIKKNAKASIQPTIGDKDHSSKSFGPTKPYSDLDSVMRRSD